MTTYSSCGSATVISASIFQITTLMVSKCNIWSWQKKVNLTTRKKGSIIQNGNTKLMWSSLKSPRKNIKISKNNLFGALPCLRFRSHLLIKQHIMLVSDMGFVTSGTSDTWARVKFTRIKPPYMWNLLKSGQSLSR